MKQNQLKNIFGIICIALAVLAVIILAVGVFVIDGDEMLAVKIMVIIVALLCLLAAGEFAYMYYIEREVKPNYFLYDANSKRNMDVQKMTFEVINRKMNHYLSGYASSEGKLWTDHILENPSLDMEDKFKPAVAYRLLFGLAEKDVDQGWKCFELASVETVQFICDALAANGDREVADTLMRFKTSTPLNLKYVRDYLVSNKAYLRTKLCNYVYDNIDKF